MTTTNLTEETVGERIRRLREEKGMSQRDMARLTKGVSEGYVSKIETGDREPSIKALREIARVLDVNAAFLETGAMVYCPHCLRRFYQ